MLPSMILLGKEKAFSKAKFDFLETMGHTHELMVRGVYQSDRDPKLSSDWRAYSIAAIICYCRPFVKAHHLPNISPTLIKEMSSTEKKLHDHFIDKRHQLVAHANGERFQIQARNLNKAALSLHSDDKYLNKNEAKDLNELAKKMLNVVISQM